MLKLSKENGRAVTAQTTHDKNVALIFWRKSGAPLLPLVLTRDEAAALRVLLLAAERGYA